MKNNKITDVRSHIDDAYKIIKAHLPKNYCAEVNKRIDSKVKSSVLRNLKYRVTKYPVNKLHILNVMLQIALEHKDQKEKLSQLLDKNQ